jgi:hypothetical protein
VWAKASTFPKKAAVANRHSLNLPWHSTIASSSFFFFFFFLCISVVGVFVRLLLWCDSGREP